MEFRVSTSTEATKLARAITQTIKKNEKIELICLGAGSVNQAVKAWIIARSMCLPTGIELKASPFFKVGEVNEEEKTFIVITIERL